MKKLASTLVLFIVITLILSFTNIQVVYCEELSIISLKDANVSVATKGNTASIVIQRTGNTTGSVTVYYRTINGSAISNTHYTPKTSSVTFNDGETSKTISVNTTDFDTWEKENRFFYVEIYKVTGNAVIDNSKDISKATINHKVSITTNGLNNWYNIFDDYPNTHHFEDNGSYTTPVQSIIGYNYWKSIRDVVKAKFKAEIATWASDVRLNIFASNNSNGSSAVGTSKYYEDQDGWYDSGEYNVSSYDYIFGRGDVTSAETPLSGDDGDINKGKVQIYITDTTKPTIQSFHVVGNTSEPYSDGDDLYISTKFNEIVTVSGGIPQLPVKFSDNSVLYASYTGGTGTDTLVFKLTIPNGKTSDGLYIYNPSNNESLVGEEYIKDIANNVMNAYSNTSCITSNIKIQNTIPSISNITSDKLNVSLNDADDVIITLNFTEPVIITGTPILNLNNGKTAFLISGTGGLVLSADFKYNIGTILTENTSELYVTSLSGGNILDYSGNSLNRAITTNNIKDNNIMIDNISPSISLSINGIDTYETFQTAIIYVNDKDDSGVDNGSGTNKVQYVWNSSTSSPSDSSFTEVGGNNLPAKISGITGDRYLHIRALDNAGNVSYFNSLVFKLDNTLPTINISDSDRSASKSHTVLVNLSDGHSGINGDFKYLWSTSTSIPTDVEFDSGSSGTEGEKITKDTGNGNYYLYIRACDKAGNENYKKSDVFVFDNMPPDVITITNKDDNGNIVGSDSDQKNYNIQISAQDTNGEYYDGDIECIKYSWSDKSEQISTTSTDCTIYNGEFSYNNNGSSGLKYLNILVEDNAGNFGYETLKYTFDYTSPVIRINSEDFTGIHNEISADIEVSDIQNEISIFKYIWRDNTEKNISEDNWITGTITANASVGNPTKDDVSGDWFLHVYCEDSVGNNEYNISGPYTLDVDGPTGEINIEEDTIGEGFVTLNITAADNIPSNSIQYSVSQDNQNWSEWKGFDGDETILNYPVNSLTEGITTISVIFKDDSDNVSNIYSDTVRIDLTPPSANVSYNPSESSGWTNQDVIASLVNVTDNLDGEVIKINGDKYTFTDNGTHTFEIKDLVGNGTTISAIVSWIDKIDPQIEQVNGNQTPKKQHSATISATDNVTQQDDLVLEYQWSNSTEEPDINDTNWTIVENDSIVSKNEVNGDWYLHIKAIDEAGNTPIITSGKFVFDNLGPTSDIVIPQEFKCVNNNKISLYLNSSDIYSDSSEIQYSLLGDNENWSEWKKYIEIINDYPVEDIEGEHEIHVKYKDILGNISVVDSDSLIIDKTPPIAELEYSSNKIDGYINDDVIVDVINISDNYSPLDKIVLSESSHIFTLNGECTFNLEDETGNVTTLSAIVDWIDKEKPSITITPNSDQTAKTEHFALLTIADNVTTSSNIMVSYQWTDNDTTPTYDDTNWIPSQYNTTVTKGGLDGDWYLHVKAEDEPGNCKTQTSGKFVLDNTGPVGSIDILEDITNINKITLSLSCSDIVSKIGNIKYSVSLDLGDSKVWSEWNSVSEIINNFEVPLKEGQTTVFVKFKDELNNESEVYSDSVILDLTPPSAEVNYSAIESDGYVNSDVIVSLNNITDNYSTAENITVSAISHTFTTNGEYVFDLADEVGNSKTIKVEVDYIDKEEPLIRSISGNQNPEKLHSGYISSADNVTSKSAISISYQWTKDSTAPEIDDSDWITVNNETSVTKSGINGDWYLHVKAEDEVGNHSTITSGKYLFDNELPNGTITYSTLNRTAQPVTATLSTNETVTITNTENGSNKYIFNDNEEFNFEFEDLAGNTNSAIAVVTWIDKSIPSANVDVSTTDWTNENILVTVSVPENSRIEILDFDFGEISEYTLEEELSRELIVNEIQDDSNNVTTHSAIYLKSYSVGENGKITFDIRDVDTLLTQDIEINIDNIDKEDPTYEISLSETDPTNNDVTVTISTDDNTKLPVQIIEPSKVTENDGQYIIGSNDTYNFKLKDVAGNSIDVPIEITNIDKKPPVLSVTYSAIEWTNQNVIATVTSEEEIIVLNNNGEIEREFTDVGVFEFQVKDLAGNTNNITAKVEKIDKQIPDADIDYIPTDITNTDVIVTITPDEEVNIISLENLESIENSTNEFKIETNGTYQFKLIDRAGNEKIKSIIITNIDKTSPEITYTLSTDEMTNQNVEIYLHGNETFEVVTVPEGVIMTGENNDIRYFAQESGEYIFIVKDKAGNEGQGIVNITNIDKIPPALSLTYSAIEWTNQDVEVALLADEQMTVLNNEGSNIYKFTQNGQFQFKARDLAGNESIITATVENIDKQIPNATITFSTTEIVNTDIIVTVTPNEDEVIIQSLNNKLYLVENTDNQFVVETNGEYYFKLIDKAGNEYIKDITINNIDKKSPEITYSLSPESKTNKEVEIYLHGDEPFDVISIPQGIRTEVDDETIKYFAQDSGEYIFTVKDIPGNEGQGIVNISNIDKIPPVLSVTYSAIDCTNNDVIATVEANEDIIVLNNNNKPEYTFTQNGDFIFNVEDIAGNEVSITATVTIIDKKAPSASFQYSTTEITKEDVIVTITGNETLSSLVSEENLEVITSSAIESSISKKFNIETSGEYHFLITDLAGNTKPYDICIVNIDKTPPVITYTLIYDTPAGIKEVNQGGVIIKGPIISSGDDRETYQNSLITKNDVRLNFNANETYEMISIPQDVTLNDDGEYIIENNGEYIFIAKDIAGNTTSVTVVVDTIEKSIPQVEIRYNETNPTKNNVVATVVSTNGEYIRVVNNYNKTKRVFSENGEYTFIVQDYAGNEVRITATVNNIDRTPPQLNLEYSTTEYTSQSVIVELTADEEINVLNNEGSKYYTFENNGEMRFVAEDTLGNTSEIIAKVDNIDKTAPVIIFTGNDKLEVLEGQDIDLLSDVSTLGYEDKKLPINILGNVDTNTPGKYIITYKITDNAGNTSIKEREVQVISKDNLLLTFNGINIDEANYISGDYFDLNTYNAKGKYTILYCKGKLTKGQIKIRGEELLEDELNIFKSGWYTFLIYDQERNTRFYNVYIIK